MEHVTNRWCRARWAGKGDEMETRAHRGAGPPTHLIHRAIADAAHALYPLAGDRFLRAEPPRRLPHTHAHAHTHTRTHKHTHKHTHAHAHAHTHAHTRTHTCTRTHAHTHAGDHDARCPCAAQPLRRRHTCSTQMPISRTRVRCTMLAHISSAASSAGTHTTKRAARTTTKAQTTTETTASTPRTMRDSGLYGPSGAPYLR
jgi:hypothetical protein